MAGFLFSLDSEESLISCLNRGIYSTRLSQPSNVWSMAHEGTFADYCSMKEGDYVYFFIKRKIFGIGNLVNINGQCKYLNYENANLPTNQNYEEIKDNLLLDYGNNESLNYRFICTFKPFPLFFRNGIDMDEILSSSPSNFKILRAFWKLSFIKFSEDENQAFKNILLRRNILAINSPNDENTFISNYINFHKEIQRKTFQNSSYDFTLAPFINTISNIDGSIKHEMAIEAALIFQLTTNNPKTISIFGSWDYLTHQVIASPFKPIDYMDKMDVFGYNFIQHQKPTISSYLVIEIKKGIINTQDVLQLMKYVDWIKNEYAYGDYNMINAFMIGHSYTDEALLNFKQNIERKFIQGVRPSVPSEWRNVKLVKYNFNSNDNILDFEIIANADE